MTILTTIVAFFLELIQIKPVPIQKTLVLLNNFIANTTNFFNAFSESVEKKISNVSNKITELETLLAVLEAKLNSVPDLNDAVPGHTSTSQPQTAQSAPATVHQAAPEAGGPAAVDPVAVAPASEAADSSQIPVSEHPDYLPFFKLLKVGVPSFVVQAKVTAAGLDGSMIDTPDRLVSR